MRETNSSNRLSTEEASTVPMVDMTMDNSRNSSSSSMPQILPPYCSPKASISTAARSGPVSCRAAAVACAWACLLASVATSAAMSFEVCEVCDFCAAAAMVQISRCAVMQPLTDDRDGFIRVLVGKLAYFLHRLGMHLALHLGDVDHLGGVARYRLEVFGFDLGDRGLHVRAQRIAGRSGAGERGGQQGGIARRGRLVGRQHPAHQRPYHQQQDNQTQQEHDAELDAAHDVFFGELEHRHPARRFRDRDGRRVCKAQIDYFHLIAALLIEADG